MRPLLASLLALSAVSASAQVYGDSANAASSSRSGGGAVGLVPGVVASPQLAPALADPSMAASIDATRGPDLGAAVPALVPSAIMPIDLSSMKAKKRDYTPAEWAKMTAESKDAGTRAVLASKPGDLPGDPRLSVTLSNGEKLQGAFRGLAEGKMVFETGGKLVGLQMDAGNIIQVRRTVDVMFDGANLRPDEVVVHDSPPVSDPFSGLGRYKGRWLDVDVRDLDDLKWSAQTVSGRVVKADKDEIVLEGPKGLTHIQREFHRIDKAVVRHTHYSSRGQISSISGVDGQVAVGQPVELLLSGNKTLKGRYFGLRHDAEGDYVLIEVPSFGGTTFRAVRDFVDLRTPGYTKTGALVEGGETVYTAPDR